MTSGEQATAAATVLLDAQISDEGDDEACRTAAADQHVDGVWDNLL